MRKLKCPSCNKTAKEWYNPETKETIVTCTARNPCGYINIRKEQ